MKVQMILEAVNKLVSPEQQYRNNLFFQGALRLVDILEVSFLFSCDFRQINY